MSCRQLQTDFYTYNISIYFIEIILVSKERQTGVKKFASLKRNTRTRGKMPKRSGLTVLVSGAI